MDPSYVYFWFFFFFFNIMSNASKEMLLVLSEFCILHLIE